jgi:hypothetical protein
MPELLADPMRRRLLLSPAGLAAAVLLLPGRLGHDRLSEAMGREVAELEARGVVRAGTLAPWAARQLTLLLAPVLHVEAVVVTSARTAITQVWARPDAAMIGCIDAHGWVELAPTGPRSLAWTLRATVGLTPRREPVVTSRQPIDPVRLARFEEALATGDHPAASVMLDNGEGHNGDELAIMAALAAPERRTWRLTAHWNSAAGSVQRWLSVLDAGRGGLWCSHGASVAGSDATEDAAPLVPTTVADTWKQLVATLPPGTADVPPASPDDGPAHPGRAPCPTPAPPSPTASSGSLPPPGISTPA